MGAAVLVAQVGRLVDSIHEAHTATGRAVQARQALVARASMLDWLRDTTAHTPEMGPERHQVPRATTVVTETTRQRGAADERGR